MNLLAHLGDIVMYCWVGHVKGLHMGHVHIHGTLPLLGIFRPLGKIHDGRTVFGEIRRKSPVSLGGICFRPLQKVRGCVGIGQAVLDDLPAEHDRGQQVLIAHNSLPFNVQVEAAAGNSLTAASKVMDAILPIANPYSGPRNSLCRLLII